MTVLAASLRVHGVPFAAYGAKGEALDVDAPAVLDAFKALRAKLLAEARRLPEP